MRPPTRQRLRPKRSVNLLHGIMSTAMIRRNRVIVVCTPFTSVFRSWLMSLIITFMFEPAKLQMNCASASGAMNARADPTQLAVVRPGFVGAPLTPVHVLRTPSSQRRCSFCRGARSDRPRAHAWHSHPVTHHPHRMKCQDIGPPNGV